MESLKNNHSELEKFKKIPRKVYKLETQINELIKDMILAIYDGNSYQSVIITSEHVGKTFKDILK